MILPQLISGAGTDFGVPISGQHLENSGYTTFYSYVFMQPTLVLETVYPTDDTDVESLSRVDCFREDARIPELFRATDEHYAGSGFDRGHLAPFADMADTRSGVDSFLLSNMSPQIGAFNRGNWRQLEISVRKGLDTGERRYIATGPIFLGSGTYKPLSCSSRRSVPVPDMFFKSTITVSPRGRLRAQHWLIRHDDSGGDAEQVYLSEVEEYSGQELWTRIRARSAIRGKIQ